MQPTIRHILELPVVVAGQPEVICPGELDRPVRWVHVSDLADLSNLIEGGELVLTTGAALADDALRDGYLPGLARAGAAGVIIELGTYVHELPASVITPAQGLPLAVIVLHRTVRFVQVTEVVHRSIVAEQYAEVEYARMMHEVFTELSVRRASVDDIVAATARLVDTPIVVEDLNRQVLAFDGAGVPTPVLLADWERRSRLAPQAWLTRPIGQLRQEWGRVVAPQPPTADNPATDDPATDDHLANNRLAMTLERAAAALALHRMAEQDRTSLELRAQSGLVDDLRRGKVRDEAEATARAHALGLRPALRYIPMTVRLAESAGAGALLIQQRRLRVIDAIVHAIRAAGHTALTAGREDGQIDVLLAVRATLAPDDALTEVCRSLRRDVTRVDGVGRCVIGVGPDASRLVDTAGALRDSAHVAEVAMSMPDGAKPFHRSADIRLRGLVALIRTDPRVQAFAESELRGLLEHRAKHGDDAFELLRGFLEVGGNKTELAKRLRLSRPTLYARLDAVARLLGVDLGDAESRTSLHVAMLILDGTAPGGHG